MIETKPNQTNIFFSIVTLIIVMLYMALVYIHIIDNNKIEKVQKIVSILYIGFENLIQYPTNKLN